jgi:small conductance mechanosensitive channel
MIRSRLKNTKDLHLERMFETRSEAWERAGLAVNVSQRAVRRARRQVLVTLPLLVGVLVLYHYRVDLLGKQTERRWDIWIQWVTVIALLALGWAFARDIGRAAGPTFFRRMDPATAGTVGFLIRLATMGITLLIALSVAGVNTGSLVAGSAFTAVVVGLAAQQTLGNLIAGVVLLTARPFRVGERIRLQAGALGGQLEGVVSSLGLLYTTIARGEDRIMVPNNGVLSAVIVPLVEPESVDVKVRLSSGVRPSHVQALLDEQIKTPVRASAAVLLEELDGDDVVVRIQATPERAKEGARLADEIIAVLASVTREHAQVNGDEDPLARDRRPERDRRPDRDRGPDRARTTGPEPAGEPVPATGLDRGPDREQTTEPEPGGESVPATGRGWTTQRLPR